MYIQKLHPSHEVPTSQRACSTVDGMSEADQDLEGQHILTTVVSHFEDACLQPLWFLRITDILDLRTEFGIAPLWTPL